MKSSFILVLAFLGVLCLTEGAGQLAVMLIFTIIGIPVSILIVILPSIALFFVSRSLLDSVFFAFFGKKYWLVTAVIVLVAMAIPPFVANTKTTARAKNMMARDFDDLKQPVTINTLAFVTNKGRSTCDEICRRLLLNGHVERVIIVRPRHRVDMGTEIDDLTNPAYWSEAYWFENRETCPTYDFGSYSSIYKLGRIDQIHGGKTSIKMVQLESAKGRCFMSGPAEIGDADAIIAYGRAKRGVAIGSIGLDFFADTVTADQLVMFQKTQGEWRPRYRRTSVGYGHHLPLFLPAQILGHGLEVAPGFSLVPTYMGGAQYEDDGLPVAAFFQDGLGFDLGLKNGAAAQNNPSIIGAFLDQSGEIDAAKLTIIDGFFDDLPWRKPLTEKQAALTLRLLRDRRVAVSKYLSKATGAPIGNNPDLHRQFSDILFQRLEEFEPDNDLHIYPRFKQIELISRAIIELPDAAITPSFAHLETLARDPLRRVGAYQLLIHLVDFGAQAVPVMLYLIDDAWRMENEDTISYLGKSSHPYRAAVEGLCRLAQTPNPAIDREAILQELFQRLKDGKMHTAGGIGALTINMFMAFGADPDNFREFMGSEVNGFGQEWFDKVVNTAKAKIDCSF